MTEPAKPRKVKIDPQAFKMLRAGAAIVQRAQGELQVEGIPTTAGFHRRVLAHPRFQKGDFDTSFVDSLQEEIHAEGH